MRLAVAVALFALLLVVTAGPTAAQRPTFALAKPHPYGQLSDAGYQFVQVVAQSGPTTGIGTGANPIRGIETKVAHSGTILAPSNAQASYSYSVGAYTPAVNGVRHWVQMGYLVLGSDGGGVARWFTQVLKCPATGNCTTVEWKMSRAGEANPPPACAACSGDAGHGGYPFAATSDANGTWTFWFDGIKKGNVSLGSAFSTVDPGAVYFLAEATAPSQSFGTGTNTMAPRDTIRTLRLWSATTGWIEPGSARVSRYASATGTGATVCPPYDIVPDAQAMDTYLNRPFYRVKAGAVRTAEAPCTDTSANLWGNAFW
jgi:hypothetical protein